MDFSMRNKLSAMTFISILAIALIYFAWLNFYKDAHLELDNNTLLSGVSNIHLQKPIDVIIDKKTNSPALDDWKPTTTPIELAEQIDWFRSRGDFAFAGDDEYGSYDMNTLIQLSDAGDVHAMHALAKLYMSEEHGRQYGIKYAEPLYWKAAIYGSSNALTELAIIEDSKRFGILDGDKRSYSIESLVYYKISEMRGDRFGYLSAGKPNLKNLGITVTEKENKYIEEKARDIYEKMVREREALGLRPFDNSVPDSVKKLFDRLETGAK